MMSPPVACVRFPCRLVGQAATRGSPKARARFVTRCCFSARHGAVIWSARPAKSPPRLVEQHSARSRRFQRCTGAKLRLDVSTAVSVGISALLKDKSRNDRSRQLRGRRRRWSRGRDRRRHPPSSDGSSARRELHQRRSFAADGLPRDESPSRSRLDPFRAREPLCRRRAGRTWTTLRACTASSICRHAPQDEAAPPKSARGSRETAREGRAQHDDTIVIAMAR